MRTVLDSDNLDDIPEGLDLQVVAYYVDGEPGTATAEQINNFMQRYPHVDHWTISRKRGVKANWIDVENGTASATDAGNDLKDGNVEGVYCSLDARPEIESQIRATGYEGNIPWWTGNWNKAGETPPTIDDGSEATQYQSPSSTPPSGGHYDRSVANDTYLKTQTGEPGVLTGDDVLTDQTAEVHDTTRDATGGQLNAPIVDAAYIPGGYFLVGADGGVFVFGAAQYWGSIPDRQEGNDYVAGPDGKPTKVPYRDEKGEPVKMPALNGSIIGIAAVDQNGYILFGDDGGVFNFGDATFHGAV